MKTFSAPTPESPYRASPRDFDPVVKEIKSLARGSVFIGLLGICFLGMIIGPFAIYCSAKARRLMNEHNFWGFEYKRSAYFGRYLGCSGFVLWTLWLVVNVLDALRR